MNNKHSNFTYAIKDNKLVCIEDVEKELSCDCVCPACKGKLIARKGNKNSHHFAHYSVDCGKGYETALHMLAKEILSESDEMILPSVAISTDSYRPNIKLYPETRIKIEYVELEKKTDDIIPDIILHFCERQLIIEISVNHKVDNVKLEKIKNLAISTLEIDLSKYDKTISKSELKHILINSNENKSWLYNDKSEKYLRELCSLSEEKPVIRRGLTSYVDFCPIRAREWRERPYANFRYDCNFCEYLIQINCGKSMSIICSGKNRIATKDDLIRVMQKILKSSVESYYLFCFTLTF